jgi:predicted nucleotidyltransferase
VALVGSYARNCPEPDSDVDLVIITKEPGHFLKDISWAGNFGSIVKFQCEEYGVVTSIRAWYENDLEVEFGITDSRWASLPIDKGTQRVISDGMLIIFERGNILSNLRNKEK